MSATPASPAAAVAVVVACTRPERIPALVDAVAAEARAEAISVEVLVAGRTGGIDAGALPPVAVLVGSPDLHPNHLRQLGIERSSAPVVAFIDDDALPAPGWLAAASRLPPDGRELWTGPEVPMVDSVAARLAADVGASLLAEGSMAHVEHRDRPVRWYEVPFCNLVIGRALLDELGPLPTDIAWDLDDFDLCARAGASGATFRSCADLRIAHDRYPATVAAWLERKARERRRTGEKLVRYPGTYARVPGVAVAAAAPWLVVLIAAAVRRRTGSARSLLRAGAVAYLAVALWDGARRGRRGIELVRFAAGLVGLHASSLAGLHVGIVEGAIARIGGRADRRVPAPYAGTSADAGPGSASVPGIDHEKEEATTWPAPS